MACSANVVYDSVCDQSRVWIEDQLDQKKDKLGLVLALKHRCHVIPMNKVYRIFNDKGYGEVKTDRWLGRWSQLGMLKTHNESLNIRYALLIDYAISERDAYKIEDCLDTIREKEKQTLEAIKADAAKKKAEVSS